MGLETLTEFTLSEKSGTCITLNWVSSQVKKTIQNFLTSVSCTFISDAIILKGFLIGV